MLKKTIKKWIRLLADRLRSDKAKRRREALGIAKVVLHEFKRLGFSRSIVQKKGKKIWQHVRFEEPLLLTPDDLWMPIDLQRLPVGVKTSDLQEDTVIKSLEDRLGKNVRYDTLANKKVCLVIRTIKSKFPSRIGIAQFAIPEDSRELAFTLGLDREGFCRYSDLETITHLLIVGATGGGKSTFLHSMLYGFITRHTADDIEIWIADLKSGGELSRYKVLMGTKKEPGIVRHLAKTGDQAILMLDQALAEMMRRNQLMEANGASNIDDLQQVAGIKLRRVVLIIDEFAMLMMNQNKINTVTIGRMAENLITQIASLGRSVGFHLVVATQFINSKVISGMILANFETRIAFSVADYRKSQLVIETSEADSLPRGRFIYREGGKTEEFQAPYISAEETRLEISRVRRHGPVGLGENAEEERFLREAKLLIAMASEHLDGKFIRDKLLKLEGVRGVISYERFAEIANRLERDRILEHVNRKAGRRILPVFIKNPELLDAMYGSNSTRQNAFDSDTTSENKTSRVDNTNVVFSDKNEEKENLGKDENVVCRVEEIANTATFGEVVPSAFLRAFSEEIKGENNENEQE